MSVIKDELEQSLQTGFIDKIIHSNKNYRPQLLINDKSSGKKVLTTIDRKLQECDEFWFSVAFVTTSGVATLINTFVELEKKGIKGKLLVSQYLNFTQPEALKRILQFNNIELKIAVDGDFHSKGYLFKNCELFDLIIGSSNLTASALCSNKEWNLKISATPESDIIHNAVNEFTIEFEKAVHVNLDYIIKYEDIYNRQEQYKKLLNNKQALSQLKEITPNAMQLEALVNIDQLRSADKNKALLISATGTGKTYLSAFDAMKCDPNKFLFVVHRANIAEAAMKTYKTVFGDDKTMGMYSGSRRELEKDFIFSTIQTISKEKHLNQFDSAHFEYIVIDETHRAGAESYKRILDHFTPKFLLGMTATPERTDGFDIFKIFDHTIAYEIRLHKALEEKMLSPFHYYGVTDITVNGKVMEENESFNLLTSQERINRIIEKTKLFGCDNGIIRGLIFCSKIDECNELSKEFNSRGCKTVSLTGSNSEVERSNAIDRLESDDQENKLDYIFTVDIFNEGIDIPRVNQVVMLRPTQSAIVFVQQLGRGLRKAANKEFLTVIDFIGNYKSSYLVPVALYGDTSYNKDTLRKLMSSGSSLIPGESTINFDKISRSRIFESIDSANMKMKKDLVNDYQLLKFELGRIPMMVDFIEHGSRDPQLYAVYSRSYFNFVLTQENDLDNKLDDHDKKLLELFSNEINNSKRVEECLILRELLKNGRVKNEGIKKQTIENYGYEVNDATIDSCINNINFKFVRESSGNKKMTVHDIYNTKNVKFDGDHIVVDDSFSVLLSNKIFTEYLLDNIDYSIRTFNKLFDHSKLCDGFVLYRKYSRKDTFRILNWKENPVAQNVGGYKISPDKTNCAIFVNYHKEDSISNSTKYEDGFINNTEFEWMSKSRRNLNSSDVQAIKNHKDRLRLLLFIKKSNDEGTEFYYMGDVTPIDNSFELTTIPDDNGNDVSVVKVRFSMNHPVEDSIYTYITKNHSINEK